MIFEFEDTPVRNAVMTVIGVGGAGGNAVNRMVDEELEGVEFVSANTDAQALESSRAHYAIQLGKKLTRGLGAGSRPEIGRQAIAESEEEVRSLLDGADLVFITAGMGGGTGTGAAPVIGEMANELGALTIAIVTRPFSFEGPKRMRQANQGLAELERIVDTMIVVQNDRLLSVVDRGTSFRDALKKADEVLLHATQGITDLIRVNGEVNVDFADVRTILACRGAALMCCGVGEGQSRAVEAAQEALSSPLLDNVSIRGAGGVLINITGGTDLAIDEVAEISTIVRDEAGDEAEIIFGAVHDEALDGQIRVTVIATGFEAEQDWMPPQAYRHDARISPTRTVPGWAGGESQGGLARGPMVAPPVAPVVAPAGDRDVVPLGRPQRKTVDRGQIDELDIPTFIRRQMD